MDRRRDRALVGRAEDDAREAVAFEASHQRPVRVGRPALRPPRRPGTDGGERTTVGERRQQCGGARPCRLVDRDPRRRRLRGGDAAERRQQRENAVAIVDAGRTRDGRGVEPRARRRREADAARNARRAERQRGTDRLVGGDRRRETAAAKAGREPQHAEDAAARTALVVDEHLVERRMTRDQRRRRRRDEDRQLGPRGVAPQRREERCRQHDVAEEAGLDDEDPFCCAVHAPAPPRARSAQSSRSRRFAPGREQ